MMMDERLRKQLEFLIEIDKMKLILRQTLTADGSRRENDAEHSWHLAMGAMTLYEHCPFEIDVSHTVKMALVHDLVEIYAGDTFAYDEKGHEDKFERELAAADKLFSMLPDEKQKKEFFDLWREFEDEQTNDARFAAAIDHLLPFINNHLTQGHTWRLNNVKRSSVMKRMASIEQVIPGAWGAVNAIVEDAIKNGWMIDDR